jgi:hypothetical protein
MPASGVDSITYAGRRDGVAFIPQQSGSARVFAQLLVIEESCYGKPLCRQHERQFGSTPASRPPDPALVIRAISSAMTAAAP